MTDYKFGTLVRNTVMLSVLKLIFTFPLLPILFALMINEIHNYPFKKILQTCRLLSPHFISWVIISSISYQFLSQSGIINTLLQALHLTSKPIGFLTEASKFWGLAIFLDVWKEMEKWWTIIFLAAITGISQDYYEAAEIDGASRLQKNLVYHSALYQESTIVVVLIMTMGNLFGGGLSGSNFEQCYLLGNSVNAATSDIVRDLCV